MVRFLPDNKTFYQPKHILLTKMLIEITEWLICEQDWFVSLQTTTHFTYQILREQERFIFFQTTKKFIYQKKITYQ